MKEKMKKLQERLLERTAKQCFQSHYGHELTAAGIQPVRIPVWVGEGLMKPIPT